MRLKATVQLAGALNTSGRVDQLEDRYLGMVEAASSNLAASTLNGWNQFADAADLRTTR